MVPPLKLSSAVLIVLGLCNDNVSSFTFLPARKTLKSLTTSSRSSSTTRTTKTVSTSSTTIHATAPNDPYAQVLENYQKRNKLSTDSFGDTSLSIPKIEDPSGGIDAVVATPPPIVDTPPPADVQTLAEKVSTLVDQVNDAASTAQQASEETARVVTSVMPEATTSATAAAAAAAKVKASSVAATATATSVATDGSTPEKVPNLLDFITTAGQNGQIAVNNAELAAASASTQDKIILLKNNMLGLSGTLGESTKKMTEAASPVLSQTGKALAESASAAGDATTATKSFVVSGATAAAASANLQALVDNLQLEEYGVWYAVGLSFFLVVGQSEKNKQETEEKYQVELLVAKDKASEAAEAAGVAAEGAKKAKEIVLQMEEEDAAAINVGQALLESTKLEELQVDYNMLRLDLQRLSDENNQLRTIVNKLSPALEGGSILDSDVKPLIEIPIVKERMERDPDEDAKILQVIKEIDDTNAKSAAKTVKTAKKKKKAKKAAKSKKATTTTTAKADVAPKKKAAKKRKAPKAKKAKKKAKATKAKEKIMPEVVAKLEETFENSKDFKKIEAAEGRFMDAISGAEAVEEIKEIDAKNDMAILQKGAKGKKKRKVVRQKKKQEKAEVVEPTPSPKAESAAPVEATNPWGVLKQSTLQRKTIAQLTAYLEEREISVSGLSKKELVGTIQSM